MKDIISPIATRVREMREIRELSVEEASRRMGITPEEYSACENGEVDIPISFLTRAADVFEVEATALLTGKSPKLHSYSLCRKGKGVEVNRMRREYRYESLAYNFVHKQVEPFHVTIQPEDPHAVIDLNTHAGQEFDYVLEGVLKMCIDNKEILMYEGDSIYFDSMIPHGMQAIGGPVSFMALVIPPRE